MWLCVVLQLLVAGQPTTATSPPLGPGAGAGGGAVTAGAVSPGSGGGAAGNGGPPPTGATSCCENGRPIMTDPVSGQTVCSCQYDSARLALSSYPRLSTSGVGVYGTPYPSTDQNPYPSIGVDSSAFYSPLVSATFIYQLDIILQKYCSYLLKISCYKFIVINFVYLGTMLSKIFTISI